MFEIEYKYLLTALPAEVASAPCLHIRQFYLPGSLISERLAKYWYEGQPVETAALVRTVKYPVTGARRIELEEEVDLPTFEFLLNCCTHVLSKRRYKIKSDDDLWEIDVIDTPTGVVYIAELECDTERTVVLPPFLQNLVVKEVTTDPAFKSEALATVLRRL